MNNKIYKFLLAVTVILLGTISAFFVCTEEVVMLNKAVPVEQTVAVEDVKTERVLFTNVNDKTARQYADLVGKVALVDLPANTPIATTAVKEVSKEEEETIKGEELVVVPVAIDAVNVPSDIKPGEFVNIIACFDADNVTVFEDFIVGFSETALVHSVATDENNQITKVDVLITKDKALDICLAVSKGTPFIIRNDKFNEKELAGTQVKDLYVKYLQNTTVEDTIEPAE